MFPKQTLRVLKDGFNDIFGQKIINHLENFTGSKNKEILNKQERIQFLEKEINLSHCSREEREQMSIIFDKYNLQFSLPGDSFQHSKIKPHRIELKPNTKPVFQRQFRIPEHQREELYRQLNELEINGIIEKSDSPWNAPIFLVPKKEDEPGIKQQRLVIDYIIAN